MFLGPAFIASAILLARALGGRRLVDVVLLSFLVLSAEILGAGYVLSEWMLFGSADAWTIAGACLLVAVAGVVFLTPSLRRAAFAPLHLPIGVVRSVRSLSTYDRWLLIPPAIVIVLLGLVNLSLVLFVAPHTVDALTHYIARVGYYLQHGSLSYFDANYPNQIVEAKNPAVLLAWAFLAAGRREAGLQAVQFVAYWIGLVAIYGSTLAAGAGRRYALLSAFVFGLLTIVLMQASTAQNELLATTYLACAVYFLLSFQRGGRPRYLVWAGVAIALVLGSKQSNVVSIPAVAIVAAFAVGRQRVYSRWRAAVVLVASLTIGAAVFAAPAGYVENYRLFGDAFTPATTLSNYTQLGKPFSTVLVAGTRNLFRYTFDFLTLDGLPPVRVVTAAQSAMRAPARALSGWGLGHQDVPPIPAFDPNRRPYAREEFSYFGVLGVGFLWLIPLAAVCGTRSCPAARVLALASIVFFVTLSYAGQDDPWRGRAFLSMAAFAIPAIGCVLSDQRGRLWRSFALVVTIAGCVSGVTAVFAREHAAPFSIAFNDKAATSVYRLDRAAQLTRHIPRYAGAVRKYEAMVPADATVAIYGDYMFEYVFFGEHLTRRLIPRGDGTAPMRQAAADFLVFSSKTLAPQGTDVHLGEDWFLRRESARQFTDVK